MKAGNVLWAACAAVGFVAGCSDGALSDADGPRYRFAPITRADVVRTVEATGTVTPRNTAKGIPVGAQVNGKVIKLFVDYNSTVTNGQVVALIDPLVYDATYKSAVAQLHVNEANVEVRKASVASCEAELTLAEKTYERKKSLTAKAMAPVADLDDKLARRLGALNMLRLFTNRYPRWVRSVVVKRGDSASRIAAENGSTLASLSRLTGGKVDRIVLGSRVYVMDHPRFALVVHRRTRTADLSLNGKFFKRYDLAGEVRGQEGAYEMSTGARAIWRIIGACFRPDDRAELEMLLPSSARVLISEM